MYIYELTSEKNSNPILMSSHSFRKNFSSMRAIVDVSGIVIYCVSCSNTATQEAIFTADGCIIIEKYCDSCSKKEHKITDSKRSFI